MYCSRRLIVQTLVFGRSCLYRQVSPPETLVVKGGTTWARNGRWISPENTRLPRNIEGSFTCRKATTWGKWLYFPSEGRRAEDFFSPWKIRRLRPGLNPRNFGTKGQHATLDHPSRFLILRISWIWDYDSLGKSIILGAKIYMKYNILWRMNKICKQSISIGIIFVAL